MLTISNPSFGIDLGAVAFHYRHMQAMVGRGTQIAAVVKSDAYGLGLVRVSQMLCEARCRLFFAANLDEALALRSAGVKAAIVVFSADIAKCREYYNGVDLIALVNGRADLEGIACASRLIPARVLCDSREVFRTGAW